jgi:hypothetical protein
MKILTTLCGAVLMFGSLLNAQTSGDRITVHFATPVMAGETRLPAGDCEIQVMHGASDNTVLLVRSKDGPSTSVLANHLSDFVTDTPGHASVVLGHHGDTYRLNRVLFADGTGYQLQSAE